MQGHDQGLGNLAGLGHATNIQLVTSMPADARQTALDIQQLPVSTCRGRDVRVGPGMIEWLTQRAVRLNTQVCEACATAVSGTVSASRRMPI